MTVIDFPPPSRARRHPAPPAETWTSPAPLDGEKFNISRGTAQIVAAAAMPLSLLSRTELADQVCDHRYHQIIDRTLGHDFPVQYIVIHDKRGSFRGAQPFFITNQNILAGVPGKVATVAGKIRRKFPAFMTLKTLMLGNPAGPGALGVEAGVSPAQRSWFVAALAEALALYGRAHKVRIVVFKDFPADTRLAMTRLTDSSAADASSAGYIRLPSMPMTTLSLGAYSSFEDYMNQTLSKITRKGLRRKFKKTADEKIEFSVTTDIDHLADEIHSLYLQVFNRASLTFEKITPEYLRQLALHMPDKARFFLWRRQGKLVAASITLVRFPSAKSAGGKSDDSALYDLYLGMDYPIALDLSLYHLTMRDVIQWAIENKIAHYVSTPLNYDAKLHFRHRLMPQDLYLRHTSPILNPAFQFAMRFAEPTRHDKILPQFPNAHELRATTGTNR